MQTSAETQIILCFLISGFALDPSIHQTQSGLNFIGDKLKHAEYKGLFGTLFSFEFALLSIVRLVLCFNHRPIDPRMHCKECIESART